MKLLIILSLLLSANLWAQKNPCTEDIKKYCLSSRQDKNAMAKCLFENKSNLSDDCKEKMDSARAKVQKVRGALKEQCGSDIEKHCANLDGQDLKRCVEVKKANFSKSCQGFLGKAATATKKARTKAP
jgi:hypothetical protein